MDEVLSKNYDKIVRHFLHLSNTILGYNIYDIISNGPIEKINNTKYTQPAIFIISCIAYEIYKEKKLKADFCAGHSVGEISALYASSALTFKDALLFIQERAESMEYASKTNPGKMLALIKAADKDIDNIIKKDNSISIANINSINQTILSGPAKSIDDIIPFCKNMKIKVIPLPVSGAFHSILMQPASDSLLKTLNQLNLTDSMMPIYQNINALPENRKEALRANLTHHITEPVQWKITIDNMIKDKASYFIEIGPKKILTNLIKKSYQNINCDSFEDFIENE